MQTETLAITNRRGDRLTARLDLPVDKDPVAYALFVHCFACAGNAKARAHIGSALTAQGIGVVRFDFTGLGEGNGDSAETGVYSSVDDLVDVARFMAESYESPSILVGHSLGAAALLLAASAIPASKVVATIAAPFRREGVRRVLERSIGEVDQAGKAEVRLGGRPFRIRKQLLDDLNGGGLQKAVENLRRALLVFHSPVDRMVDVDDATDLFRAAKHPKNFIALDDADHMLSDQNHARYVGSVLGAWCRTYVATGMQEAKYVRPDDNRIYASTGESGFITQIMANSHALVADEPKAVGGTDAGPSPYDFVVAGLGACTGMTLRMYADRKKWPLSGVAVKLRHQKIHARDCSHCDTAEGKIDHIEREIELAGPLDDEQRARLIEIASRCPVHRTLEGAVHIETIEAPAP